MRTPRILATSSKDKPDVKTVGRCIYCGAHGPTALLTREHVIPIGLGGGVILHKASCESCRKITHAFETKTLRGLLHDFRLKAKMARHPKEAPTHLMVRKNSTVPGDLKPIPLEDYPFVLHVPHFKEPGILQGRQRGWDYIEYFMDTLGNPEHIQALADKFGGPITPEITVHLREFLQMLAKIAHGLAWFYMGPENFVPYLPDMIVRGDLDVTYFVGEPKNPHRRDIPGMQLHGAAFVIRRHDDKLLLDVHLTLLQHWKGPTYSVVVGEFVATDQWLAANGLRREGGMIAEVPQ